MRTRSIAMVSLLLASSAIGADLVRAELGACRRVYGRDAASI